MKSVFSVAVLSALLAVAATAQNTADDDGFQPVTPDQLMKVFPGGTKDFKAGKPDGHTSGELGSMITFVTRVYTYQKADSWFGGDDDEDEPKPTITIKISDSTASKSFSALHNKLAEMGQSETSGFSNALSIDGHLAIQNYREKDQVGLLSVYAADRFLVQIAIKGLPKETMMEWWEKIDDKKLAKLATTPTPTAVPTPSHTPAETPTSSS